MMDNFNAIGIAEGFMEAESEEQMIEAWQHLVDTGLAWKLQGSFGRTATTLIDDGILSIQCPTCEHNEYIKNVGCNNPVCVETRRYEND